MSEENINPEEGVSRCDSDVCEEQTEVSTTMATCDEVAQEQTVAEETAVEEIKEEAAEETTQETVAEEAAEEAPVEDKKPAKAEKKAKKDKGEEGKGRVIVITSGKGGVGKTTTSANIGTALAKGGNKVVLIDTDIGLRNLDLLLGLENRIVYTIVDVVEDRCKLKQALVKDKKNPNLCLLAAAQTRDKSALSAEQLQDICWDLKKEFDFVLLDCPAGIEQGFKNATAGAREAIVVTTPEMSAIRDADRIIGLLETKEEIESYRLLVNRVRPNLVKNQDMMSVDDVVEILRAELIGVIPEDTGVITSTNKGEPIVNDEKSLAGMAYTNVAKRILGEEVPFLDINEPKNIVEKIKKFFIKVGGGAKQ